jgi:hypothetical protein
MFGSKPKKQKKNIYDNLSQGVLMQLQNLKNAQGKQTSKHRAKANELSRAVSKVNKLIQYFVHPNYPKVLSFVYIEKVEEINFVLTNLSVLKFAMHSNKSSNNTPVIHKSYRTD